jgi:hypothetical protein
LVVGNFTDKTLEWSPAVNDVKGVKEVLLNTYEEAKKASPRFAGEKWSLQPYEAVAVLVQE